MFIVADKIWLCVDDVMFLFADRSQISLDETPQPVTVQFVPNGVCFLCVVHVLVDVIDLAYFHSAYFYILLPALSFFFFCCSGAGFRDLSKLTSEEQRFHRRRLYTQNSAPQTASERQRH